MWFIPVAICHVVDNGGKFAIGINDTSAVPVAKFAAGVFDTVALSVIQCSELTTGHFFDTGTVVSELRLCWNFKTI